MLEQRDRGATMMQRLPHLILKTTIPISKQSMKFISDRKGEIERNQKKRRDNTYTETKRAKEPDRIKKKCKNRLEKWVQLSEM